MDLVEFENKRAGSLSGGNKRKLCVAIGATSSACDKKGQQEDLLSVALHDSNAAAADASLDLAEGLSKASDDDSNSTNSSENNSANNAKTGMDPVLDERKEIRTGSASSVEGSKEQSGSRNLRVHTRAEDVELSLKKKSQQDSSNTTNTSASNSSSNGSSNSTNVTFDGADLNASETSQNRGFQKPETLPLGSARSWLEKPSVFHEMMNPEMGF